MILGHCLTRTSRSFRTDSLTNRNNFQPLGVADSLRGVAHAFLLQLQATASYLVRTFLPDKVGAATSPKTRDLSQAMGMPGFHHAGFNMGWNVPVR